MDMVSGWVVVMFTNKPCKDHDHQPPPGGTRMPMPLTFAVKVLVSHGGIAPLVKGMMAEPCPLPLVHRPSANSAITHPRAITDPDLDDIDLNTRVKLLIPAG